MVADRDRSAADAIFNARTYSRPVNRHAIRNLKSAAVLAERAALSWAEAVTKLENGSVPESIYEQARKHFDERALMKLTLLVVAINGWNRFCISFNATPGTYVAGSLGKSGVAEVLPH